MATTSFAELKGEPVSQWLSEPLELGDAETILTVDAEAVAAGIDRLELEPLIDPRPPGSPPLQTRKNQVDLDDGEWTALVRALEAIAADDATPPSWQDLVQIHIDAMANVGMSWGVHHMGMGMPGEGRNFLVWHRAYLTAMEERLRQVEPNVMIPYWNWVNDRQVPAALSDAPLLQRLGVTRYPRSESLPLARDVQALLQSGSGYLAFQEDLEGGPHNAVHRVVGGTTGGGQAGTMATSASPKDPIFWLHHAMVDNIWAHWDQSHGNSPSRPPNEDERLQPSPPITGSVAEHLSVFQLGFTYE
jgi:tyrosinase-like protein